MRDASEKITVLVVEPGKEPYEKDISPGLASLQHEVGGHIQAVYPHDDPVSIICDEESKLKGSPLNRALRDEDGHIYDVLAGTFLITGLAEETFSSLGEDLMQKYKEHYKMPEMFLRVDGRLVVLPMEPAMAENKPKKKHRNMER